MATIPKATIIGSNNYEYINWAKGNNVYLAKQGNDWIRDSGGNDTYIYRPGDGQDTILDYGGNDTIFFTNGINKNDLLFYRWGNNLQICVKDSYDKVDWAEFFSSSNRTLEQIKFENGQTMSRSEINSLVINKKVAVGTSGADILKADNSGMVLWGIGGNDKIYGGSGDDVVYAGGGSNTVYGNAGKDTIYNGFWNDNLFGGAGDDTYTGYEKNWLGKDIINDQSGSDTLNLENFSKSQFNFKAIDYNTDGKYDSLYLTYNSSNSIKILSYFDNNASSLQTLHAGSGCVENINFHDVSLQFSEIHDILI